VKTEQALLFLQHKLELNNRFHPAAGLCMEDTTVGYPGKRVTRQVDSPGLAGWQITNFYAVRYTCDNTILYAMYCGLF
jgi:hypothetical protein